MTSSQIDPSSEAGKTLNITFNFLYRNHQVHRDFLITLYFYGKISLNPFYNQMFQTNVLGKIKTYFVFNKTFILKIKLFITQSGK
jgi:hypothetical protein